MYDKLVSKTQDLEKKSEDVNKKIPNANKLDKKMIIENINEIEDKITITNALVRKTGYAAKNKETEGNISNTAHLVKANQRRK